MKHSIYREMCKPSPLSEFKPRRPKMRLLTLEEFHELVRREQKQNEPTTTIAKTPGRSSSVGC